MTRTISRARRPFYRGAARRLRRLIGRRASSALRRARAPAPTQTPVPSVSKADAFRFLNQATMGATQAEADRVVALGYEAWIDEQLLRPASLRTAAHPSAAGAAERPRPAPRPRRHLVPQRRGRVRSTAPARRVRAVGDHGRVAGRRARQSAVSRSPPTTICSRRGASAISATLIEAVTLHPAMGVYLSMLGNQKPNPAANIRPDENYARELMQLFTIGLVELAIDGTPRLDGAGQPIPTYTQPIIEGFAHAYTGWTYAGTANFAQPRPTRRTKRSRCSSTPDFHDTGRSSSSAASRFPAGQGGAAGSRCGARQYLRARRTWARSSRGGSSSGS